MFRGVDLEVDSEGDLVVGSNGDISLATPSRTLQQDFLFRLKTSHQDYTPDPFVGANLRSFQGEPNVERTGLAITENVYISLTRDGSISPQLLFVDTVPVAINTVAIMVLYTGGVEGVEEPVTVATTLSLEDSGTNNESILNVSEL
jgi:hypothetical protein